MYRRTLFLRPALGLVVLLTLVCTPGLARADDASSAPTPSPAAAEMLKSMREKGILSEKEYEDLYRRQARYEAEQKAKAALPGWLQNWTFGGDFRLRWERQDYGHGSYGPDRTLVIGKDNVDAINGTATGVRDRYRIRLRLGAEKRLGEGLTFGFRIVTSSPTSYGGGVCAGLAYCGVFGTSLAADPRSSNATLGGFFDPKNIYLDRAYVKWQPDFAPTLELMAGKFENPFLSRDDPADMIVWDHDISPEGAALKYRFDFIPNAFWFDTTWAYFTLSEIPSVNIQSTSTALAPGDTVTTFQPSYDERNPYMYGFQGGLTAKPSEWWKLGVRASYYDLEHMNTGLVAALNGLGNTGDSVDHNPLLVITTPTSPLFQNGSSKGQMEEVQASSFVTFSPFGPNYAITPFFQWTSITNASTQNVGWAAGFDFGTPDLLKLTVMYADVGRNGTVALFTDSDLFGGYTNAKGWYVKLQRQLTKSLRFEAAFSKSHIAQSKCVIGETNAVLCDTGFTANQPLADAYNQTKLDRLLIQLDLVLQF